LRDGGRRPPAAAAPADFKTKPEHNYTITPRHSSEMASNHAEFAFDIACPFAYLCSTRIEAAVAAANPQATLSLVPILLGGLYLVSKAPQGAASASTVYVYWITAVPCQSFKRFSMCSFSLSAFFV
jgi:hypothetical protein